MKKRLLSFVMAVIMTVMSVSVSDFRSYAEENSDKIASDATLSSKIDDSTVDALSNTDSKAEETVVSSNEGGGQIEYKVTFNSDGGSTVEPKVVNHNSKVEKPKDPTKEGHKFLGWYNGEELFDFDNKTITNNITLTARWEKLYKVTFSFGNGRTKDLEQYYERGKLVTEPKDKPDLGVESHEFEHWMIRNGEKYNFNQPITSDLHLVAKYKVKEYNVKFLTKDGAEYQTIKVKHGESVSKLPELKDEKGFKKLNWVIQGKDMQFTTEYKVESNLVIEPSYEKLYKVTFSFDNGRTEDLEQYYEKDAKVNRPTEDPIPAKDSYEFEYWTIRKAGGIKEKYDFNMPINADIHLVAKYKLKEYKVTFNSDGGSTVEPKVVDHNSKVEKPKDPTKEGHKFLGWYNGEELFDFDNKTITNNITLTARWEKLYKVTFSFGNGRTKDLEQYYERGKLVTEPKDKPDLGVESHEFEHWMIRNGEKYNFNQPITSDLHLVAKYKVKEYTVSFNTDGGKENIAPIVVKYGSKVEKPKDPTKEGHTFKEWQLDDKEYKFETPVKSNITLKAVWEPIVNNPGNPSTPGGSVNPGTQPSQPAPQPPTGGGGGGGGGGASTPATTIAENIVPLAPLPEDSTIAVFVINSKDYQMREDGKMVSKKLDIAPIIHNSRTMLPVRITGEVLGIKADYDNSTKTAKFTYIGEDKKENIIEMTIRKKMMKVNGVETALTADIMVINGRMILPISDVQRAFKGLGLNIDILWNNETKEVTLKRSEK
ncbi:MAG: InlB B-repeat-containing protein [Peptostreptococcaceae bacterium]|nr:InlB B-repeat-containing protein [Peptostreptococcaceae bacterium]